MVFCSLQVLKTIPFEGAFMMILAQKVVVQSLREAQLFDLGLRLQRTLQVPHRTLLENILHQILAWALPFTLHLTSCHICILLEFILVPEDRRLSVRHLVFSREPMPQV